jgi:hypothetical protein
MGQQRSRQFMQIQKGIRRHKTAGKKSNRKDYGEKEETGEFSSINPYRTKKKMIEE